MYERCENALKARQGLCKLGTFWPISNFRIFCQKKKSLELLNIFFENSSPKGSFGENKKIEFFLLSPDSWKLLTTSLNAADWLPFTLFWPFHSQRQSRFFRLASAYFPQLCIVFKLFRLFTPVMFSIFMVNCTLYHDSTSVDCEGFAVYNIPHCDPYCWKTIWLVCSIITEWFCLLNTKMLPRLRPARNKKIFWSIIKKPYFWSLNTTAGSVVLYDILIMVNNSNAKIHVEYFVVVSKLWTLYLLFQLNSTFPPSKEKGFQAISRGACCLTLSVFALDNLCKFLVVTSQVAFKFYTVEHMHGITKPMIIVDLMLMIINASLYLSFPQFFWQMLFRGDEDILTVFKRVSVNRKYNDEFLVDENPSHR